MHYSLLTKEGSEKPDLSSENENSRLLNENILHDTSDMLTLEGLRRHYNSCSNCGVSWYDDHISLDCSECGGYAMCRPCVQCNGQCGSMWRRDVKASHLSKQAEWLGSCSLNYQWDSKNLMESNDPSESDSVNFENSYHHCIHLSSKPKAILHDSHIL
ncbi:uncharacterized protein LOC129233727 isoform X2 [Uloborus diversus]|nr:uncharacterized protein LOC129233727 isoform X2 [Uloborus diversus]XP_054723696.1 uncharacterized protein LOC129233727 isoform X2 [Uloborus diversus]XP_054723703.1 uncharacterized protein LOC129233727 isoform X2 [Uloborus diversus]XP_054723711.1 uncharacterized protein LOC129233727 isoform X2 [Uloborus diversus]